jgi:hypothetical protein
MTAGEAPLPAIPRRQLPYSEPLELLLMALLRTPPAARNRPPGARRRARRCWPPEPAAPPRAPQAILEVEKALPPSCRGLTSNPSLLAKNVK